MAVRLLLLISILSVGLLSSATHADWINLTGAETAPNIAEIYVLDDHVKILLEVYVRELEIFEELIPDDWLTEEHTQRPNLMERLRQFSSNKFQVITDSGEKLIAKPNLVEPRMRVDRKSPFAGMVNPFTQQPVPEAPADKRVLYAELFYPFKEKPKSLTIIPPLDKEERALVSIGFITYHKTVPVIDFRYLGAQVQLTLDWEDPWYSAFNNPNLKRHHKDALMSFLYVEPRVVRHEGLLRVRDLQEWTDINISNATTLNEKEQIQIKELARDFFIKRNPLTIDGKKSLPSSSRAVFLKITSAGLRAVNKTEPLDPSTAIVGVTQSHWVKYLPQYVKVDWNLFNNRINRVPNVVTDPAGPFPSFITKEDAVIEWKNFLHTYTEPKLLPVTIRDGRSFPVPIVSLLLLLIFFVLGALAFRSNRRVAIILGGLSISCLLAAVLMMRVAIIHIQNPLPSPPSETTGMQIATSVLTYARYAFLEKEPATLNMALEVIVDSNQFDDIVSELKRAFAIEVSSGGIASVEQIENLELMNTTMLENIEGFRTLANWTVIAKAQHWGHVDQRTISYRALMELAKIKGVWKLVGLTILDAKPAN